MIYFPPCNCSFGSFFGDAPRLYCDGPPSHRGDHYDREAGARWSSYGRRVRRCQRRACTDPDYVLVSPDGSDRIHLCSDGHARQDFERTLIAEGWVRA